MDNLIYFTTEDADKHREENKILPFPFLKYSYHFLV